MSMLDFALVILFAVAFIKVFVEFNQHMYEDEHNVVFCSPSICDGKKQVRKNVNVSVSGQTKRTDVRIKNRMPNAPIAPHKPYQKPLVSAGRPVYVRKPVTCKIICTPATNTKQAVRKEETAYSVA